MTDDARKRYNAWIEEHSEEPPPTHRLRYTIEVEMTVAVPPWVDLDEMMLEATVPEDIPYRIIESWNYIHPPLHIHDDKMIGYMTKVEEV